MAPERFSGPDIFLGDRARFGSSRPPPCRPIVTAVVRLAQSLNLITVAEGVENGVQHARLVELGCRLAQGYLLGEPGDLTALATTVHTSVGSPLAASGATARG